MSVSLPLICGYVLLVPLTQTFDTVPARRRPFGKKLFNFVIMMVMSVATHGRLDSNKYVDGQWFCRDGSDATYFIMLG